ncbi:MAG: hypothetical protein GNW80_03000 [Asgard group archaeon]|nr:hypothetical protein [Asgard group archaeon]
MNRLKYYKFPEQNIPLNRKLPRHIYEITHSARARDFVTDLSNFTKEKYLEIREAELRWIEQIKNMPIKKKTGIFYRRK